MEFGRLGTCKMYALVTNRRDRGDEIIAWHRLRCGRSEQVHSVMKSDLAGGQMPSGRFGANAAWWAIVQLALNLNEMLKRLAMDESWWPRRFKAIRLHVIGVAGRVVEHARTVVVRLSANHPSAGLLASIRARILALEPLPTG